MAAEGGDLIGWNRRRRLADTVLSLVALISEAVFEPEFSLPPGPGTV